LLVEYRCADGHYDELPRLAHELVAARISVLFTPGGTATALAAKRASNTVPIVFVTGGDPVSAGLVKSLSDPGGNVTGINLLAGALNPKRLQVIRQLVPQAQIIGFLYNPQNPNATGELKELAIAARQVRVVIKSVAARDDADLDAAFRSLSKQRLHALIVATDAFLNRSIDHLVGLAAQAALPTIYGYRQFASAGGLAAYGTNESSAQVLAGAYVGRILKGAKPSELPVQQSSTVELVLNRKTAKALGLAIPKELLLRADEVID
jgi:putative ABC transport system substrate-binding protein